MDKASALLLLGLQDGDLTRASLKAAYRAAVQINHPDRHQGNEKLRKHAEEQCRRINEARDVLERYLDREERCGRADARAAGAGAGSDGRSRANDKAAGPQRTATGSAKEKPSSASSDSSKRASGASKESRAASGSTARQAPNQSSGAGASAGATPKESRGAQSRAVAAQRESRIAWNVCAVIAVMAFLVASAPVPSGVWEYEVASMKGRSAEIAQCVYVARQDDLAVIAARKGTKEDFFVVRARDLVGATPGDAGYVGVTGFGKLRFADPPKPCTFLLSRTYATLLQYILEDGGRARDVLPEGYLGEAYTSENYCFSMLFPGEPVESSYATENESYGTINTTRFFAREGNQMAIVEIQYGEEFLKTVREKKQGLILDSFLEERVEACIASYAELLDISGDHQIETGRIDGVRAAWAITPSYVVEASSDGEITWRGAKAYLYAMCIATDSRVYLLSGVSPTEELAEISLSLFEME